MNTAFIWIPAALIGAWVVGGYLTVRNVPVGKYSVVAEKDGYEIRQYEPYVLAETPLRGESGNSGFRELFAYISGANTGNAKLAMTAPVLRTESAGGGVMAFVMPPGLKLEDLPRPSCSFCCC